MDRRGSHPGCRHRLTRPVPTTFTVPLPHPSERNRQVPCPLPPAPAVENARTPGGLHLPDLTLDRRSFLGLSAAGAGALAVAACAGPSTASAGSSSTPSASTADWTGVRPAKAISFWSNHPGGSQETEQKLVDAYNASQSDTTVTFSAATGYIPTPTSADVSSLVAKAPQIQTEIDQIAVVRTQDDARAFLPGGDKAIADGFGRVVTQNEDAKKVLTEVKAQLIDIYTTDVTPHLI